MNINAPVGIGIISIVLIICCFYYTLTFIENLKGDDERVAKQSKVAAIVCLSLALIIPFVYHVVV
ncbi:hypothetical protein SAMN05216389_12243 [Oceanobacillus limi]|uniref:Uncharacterized protein n=1 Tax=Oceanobacillus limi TaxID=930131 RepID=A0A1I0GJG9_9BACI|nr:hypothetical protein [Oceanobacillus limi]SET71346.1 hypothetical protein SAMN05216389_12243 [Oceanobacillus limi]